MACNCNFEERELRAGPQARFVDHLSTCPESGDYGKIWPIEMGTAAAQLEHTEFCKSDFHMRPTASCPACQEHVKKYRK